MRTQQREEGGKKGGRTDGRQKIQGRVSSLKSDLMQMRLSYHTHTRFVCVYAVAATGVYSWPACTFLRDMGAYL